MATSPMEITVVEGIMGGVGIMDGEEVMATTEMGIFNVCTEITL